LTYEHLRLERHGRFGWLFNNRPEAAQRDETPACGTSSPTRRLELTPTRRCGSSSHTGEGRAFQTGVDVAEIASDGVGMQRYRSSVEDFDLHFTAWHQKVTKPVITAVNGICCGGGFHWIADADHRHRPRRTPRSSTARVDRPGSSQSKRSA